MVSAVRIPVRIEHTAAALNSTRECGTERAWELDGLIIMELPRIPVANAGR
jgi:hypothetical protein